MEQWSNGAMPSWCHQHHPIVMELFLPLITRVNIVPVRNPNSWLLRHRSPFVARHLHRFSNTLVRPVRGPVWSEDGCDVGTKDWDPWWNHRTRGQVVQLLVMQRANQRWKQLRTGLIVSRGPLTHNSCLCLFRLIVVHSSSVLLSVFVPFDSSAVVLSVFVPFDINSVLLFLFVPLDISSVMFSGATFHFWSSVLFVVCCLMIGLAI
jgi:hypothetical protein